MKKYLFVDLREFIFEKYPTKEKIINMAGLAPFGLDVKIVGGKQVEIEVDNYVFNIKLSMNT